MSRVPYDLRCPGRIRARKAPHLFPRPTLTIALALMVVTAGFAFYDMYLFISSGLH